jgi:hypothetical protein
MQQLIEDIGAMLSAPFVGDVDLVQLFLIVGLVIVFAAIWFLVLQHILYAAEEVV